MKSGVNYGQPIWADKERKVDVLKSAIVSAYPELNDIEVSDLGQISEEEIILFGTYFSFHLFDSSYMIERVDSFADVVEQRGKQKLFIVR